MLTLTSGTSSSEDMSSEYCRSDSLAVRMAAKSGPKLPPWRAPFERKPARVVLSRALHDHASSLALCVCPDRCAPYGYNITGCHEARPSACFLTPPPSSLMSTFTQTLPSGIAGAVFPWPQPSVSQPETAFPSGARAATKPQTMEDASRQQDNELIARTQAGDASAFDELIVKYSPRLYGLVYNMTSNHEDTNDLLQDIWAKAYRSINGFRGQSSFYTWIHSIGVNMTINFLKKRGRRLHMSLDDVDSGIQNDKEFHRAHSRQHPGARSGPE